LFALYTLLYTLGLVALLPRVLLDIARGGRYSVALTERLGAVPTRLDEQRGAIWLHAVSVGEVHAARGLIPHLRRQCPGTPVVLSTTTPTGQAMARGSSGADATFFMPLDLPTSVEAYMRALEPSALILVETEIWPTLLRACDRRGIPVALVNARLSAQSYRRYRWMALLWPAPLRFLGRVCARTEQEAERFRRLGIDTSRVWATGNLKADAESQSPPAKIRRRLADELGIGEAGGKIIVAGCTMPDEEEKVLRALRRVREHHPQARLLLAPRHPERFDAVADLVGAAGFSCRRRTEGARGNKEADVLLLDTLGELPTAYGLGQVAFVGGSLVNTGGHNLLEPAVQGRPVVFGPHTDNFTALASELVAGGGGVRVADAEGLAATIDRLLSDDAERAAVGGRARAVALSDSAAGSRTARILARWLETGRST
jgi:3-deoxy-D-manno-octulosonic-acid transferase